MEGKNTRMLFNLGTWMATTLGWASLLWFGLKLELASYFPLTLIAIHLVPPLLITLVVAAWRHVRKRCAASREAERLAFEQEKHVAAQLAAQQAHLAYMAQRREGCDCRGVAVTGLRVPDDQVLQCLPQGDGLYWSLLELEDEPKAQDPHAALVPPLQEALQAVYQRCPAAIWLPLFICPPAAAQIGASWQDWVHDAAQSVARTIVGDQLPAMSLRLLPEAVHITERYLDLFESDPTLPGAIVLGFDSPAMFGVPDTPCDVSDPTAQESRLWLGRPGQAVVALLLTAPWLAHQVDSLRVKTSQPVVDSYTPYWDRDTEVHDEAWFAQIPAPWRDSLLDVPVLARLYRGGYSQSEQVPVRPLALADCCLNVLDCALINAGLREMPYGAQCSEAIAKPLDAHCRWLVHHAGSVERGGVRLAALGNALTSFGIDLHPIDDACNSVVLFGHVGRVLPLLLSALTIAHASRAGGALCVEFPSSAEIAAWLALSPARKLNLNG